MTANSNSVGTMVKANRFRARSWLILLVGLSGCASYPKATAANFTDINSQPPGKYKDYVEYLIANDPSLMQDVTARGGGEVGARCVADYIARTIFPVHLYPERVNEAVTGKRPLTEEELSEVADQFNAMSDIDRDHHIQRQAVDSCIKS